MFIRLKTINIIRLRMFCRKGWKGEICRITADSFEIWHLQNGKNAYSLFLCYFLEVFFFVEEVLGTIDFTVNTGQ